MKFLITTVNYLLVGQYASKMKRVSNFESDEDKILVVSNCLYAPLTTIIFPFIVGSVVLIFLIAPKFIIAYKRIFAILFTGVWYLVFVYVLIPYYVNNELYKPALEEYSQLSDLERQARRRIQVLYLILSIAASLILFITLGVLGYRNKLPR